MLPQNNQMVNPADLVELNEALRKSAGLVGYQTPAQPDAGAGLSPLVPQSIEGMLSVATHTMNEIALWRNMPKTSVANSLHEYVVVEEHGLDLDPFIAEGGGGSDFATGSASYDRKSVKVKYMAERRQISDVASMVGLIGDNRTAMAEETERGTLSLMRKVESQLWHGDEGLNPEGFDGIIKQISDSGSKLDLNGSVPTPLLLQEILGEVYASPNYGRPDTIYVEPRIHAELIRQSVENGRHDMFTRDPAQGVTFGQEKIFITAPYGKVQVMSAPFLHTSSLAPSAAIGSLSVEAGYAAPTFAVTSPLAGSALAAGKYFYKVVAVGKSGALAPVTSGELTVGAGDGVTISLAADANVNYYRIYRSELNGAAGTCRMIARVKGDGTDYLDKGQHAYNASNIVFAQHTPDAMQFVRLLDLIRRPLAETSTIRPFLLMLFGSPVVKLPRKMFVLEQAGFSSTSGISSNYLNADF
jgi:hypothetical protein